MPKSCRQFLQNRGRLFGGNSWIFDGSLLQMLKERGSCWLGQAFGAVGVDHYYISSNG